MLTEGKSPYFYSEIYLSFFYSINMMIRLVIIVAQNCI